MAERIGLREAARQLGMSAPALLQAFSEWRATRGPDGSVDVDKVRVELAANTDAALSAERKSRNFGSGDRPRGGGATLNEERLRGEQLKNELREIEVAKARGELLAAVDVKAAVEAANLAVRDRLRAIPMSLTPHLIEAAHKADAEQAVYQLLLGGIDEALTDIGGFVLLAEPRDDPGLDE